MWRGQFFHFTFIGLSLFILSNMPSFSGEFGGLDAQTWFWISIATPILHQVFVAIAWRTELHHRLVTRTYGRFGFRIYVLKFFTLFIGRFLSLWALAIANRGTLSIPGFIRFSLIAFFGILGFYTLYSVARYFGFKRAAGGDHFFEEYRHMPLVKDGMFKYSSNSMYTFAFLLFWIFGLAYESAGALVSVAFAHLYIWVHYFCTEKPDMNFIYGQKA